MGSGYPRGSHLFLDEPFFLTPHFFHQWRVDSTGPPQATSEPAGTRGLCGKLWPSLPSLKAGQSTKLLHGLLLGHCFCCFVFLSITSRVSIECVMWCC